MFMNRFAKKFVQSTVIPGLALSLFSASAIAADDKDFSGRIGVVNSERIFKDSDMAKASQTKLQSEFAKREKELRDDAQKIKTAAER
jgi:outer membrane protein